MCIPIFLQGEDRLAAPASIWLFHEAAQRQANGILRTDTAETWRLFRKYYAPAGVPTPWLKSIAPMIEETDLWQTALLIEIVDHLNGGILGRTDAVPQARLVEIGRAHV